VKANGYIVTGLLLLMIGIFCYNMPMTGVEIKFVSSFPYDGLKVSVGDFTEINVYIQIPNVTVNAVYYTDSSLDGPVELHRASNVSKNYYWIPDFNGDGAVNDYEISEIQKHYGDTVPPAPKEYDFNSDGIIDMSDAGELAKYYGITIYVAEVDWEPLPGLHAYKFIVDSAIGKYETSGSFELTQQPVYIPPNPFPAPEDETLKVPLSFFFIIAGGVLTVWGIYKIKPERKP